MGTKISIDIARPWAKRPNPEYVDASIQAALTSACTEMVKGLGNIGRRISTIEITPVSDAMYIDTFDIVATFGIRAEGQADVQARVRCTFLPLETVAKLKASLSKPDSDEFNDGEPYTFESHAGKAMDELMEAMESAVKNRIQAHADLASEWQKLIRTYMT